MDECRTLPERYWERTGPPRGSWEQLSPHSSCPVLGDRDSRGSLRGKGLGAPASCETPAVKQSCGFEWVQKGTPEGLGWELGPGLLLCLSLWKGAKDSQWLSVCPSLPTSLGQSKATQEAADGL